MKTRRFLIVVMFLFTSAPLVWADDQAASVDSPKKRAAQGDAEAQYSLLWNGFPERAQMAPEWRHVA